VRALGSIPGLTHLPSAASRVPAWRSAFVFALATVIASAGCKSDYPGAGGKTAAAPGAPGARAGGAATGGRASGEPRMVRIATVVQRPIGESVSVNGTLAVYDRATMATKVAGRVQALTVDLGSPVRRGQLLARIEPAEYELRAQQADAALAQARARLGLPADGSADKVDPGETGTVRQARAVLDEARKAHERSATLFKEGLIGKAEFDSADAKLKVAESQYQDALEEIQSRRATASERRAEAGLARQQLSNTGVYASFDGVVEQRRTSLGEFLAAGAPVVDIVRINPLRFRAEVPEREAGSVRPGQAVRISVDGSHEHTGKIARMSPTINERNRVLLVEADIPNDGSLRAGAFARAVIETGQSVQSATVPSSAIVTFAGLQKVLTVQNGKAVEKAVSTGRRTAEWTEVLSGVAVGDQVVLAPGNLQSGQPVVVAGAGPAAADAGTRAASSARD
jgi:RND family efflux transporter MFP subunit